MATFVLIPGAWHGAWCWERVTPLLEAAGHRVITPELVGMGADRARAAQGGLGLWAGQIEQILRAEAEPVYLCGHSRGGAVISTVAERMPEQVAALVYITALLLPDGISIRERLAGIDDRASIEVVKAPDGTSSVPPDQAAPALYNTTPADWTERAVARLGPEPFASLSEPVRVTDERYGRVPRAYVECLQDLAIPHAAQRAMQAVLPCAPVVTLDCDHSPFYSVPEALAAALQEVARAHPPVAASPA